jgi:DNA-binding GntR family transcriptional regulator
MAEKTQTKTAYQELRRRILILELIPGERLKEEAWATKLLVSRTAVREALTQLLGEGLVRTGDRGGFFVTQMEEKDIHEVRELREVLETAAFTFACDRITEEELVAIEETCTDFANLARKGYHSGACECDLRFHQMLVAASGNSHLVQAYERSNIPLFHMRVGRSLMYTDDHEETESEHHAIVAALRKRAKTQGVELLRQHFRRGEQLALGKAAPIRERATDNGEVKQVRSSFKKTAASPRA